MTAPKIRTVRGLAPPKSRALCFLDLEHCGFGKKQGHLQPVTEVAVIKRKGLPPYSTETLDVQVQMTDWEIEHADPKALEVNGYDSDLWAETAMPKAEAFTRIHDFIASHTVVGFNVNDDLAHLESEFRMTACRTLLGDSEQEVVGIPLVRRWCQTLELSTILRHKYHHWGRWNLAEACDRFGLQPEGVHRAMGGATRAMKVWDTLIER